MILERKPGSTVAEAAAPYQPTLGMMLPYTPLHLLLLEPAPDFPDVLVMTSGNLSEEPIAYTDEDAHERLAGLADGLPAARSPDPHACGRFGHADDQPKPYRDPAFARLCARSDPASLCCPVHSGSRR